MVLLYQNIETTQLEYYTLKSLGKAISEGMLEEDRKIRQRFMIFGEDNYRIYVDASNLAFIRSLKLDIGEYVDYENQLQAVKTEISHKLEDHTENNNGFFSTSMAGLC